MSCAIALGRRSSPSSPRSSRLEEKREWIATQSGVAIGSDAFFPFGDKRRARAQVGRCLHRRAGGSIRDDNVIETANRYGIANGIHGHALVPSLANRASAPGRAGRRQADAPAACIFQVLQVRIQHVSSWNMRRIPSAVQRAETARSHAQPRFLAAFGFRVAQIRGLQRLGWQEYGVVYGFVAQIPGCVCRSAYTTPNSCHRVVSLIMQ
jgi:hypothetical protein